MSGPEATLQKSVVEYLRVALRPYRGLVGVIPNNRAARRTVGFTAGEPDVYAFVRGQLFGFELKAPKKKPEKHQNERHDAWRQSGAEVFVVRDLETVEGIVAALRAGRVREEGV